MELVPAVLSMVVLTTQFIIAVVVLVSWFHGLFLALHANMGLGIAALFVPPAATVVGIVDFISHVDLAQALAKALGLH
jgi:hypothetical protein